MPLATVGAETYVCAGRYHQSPRHPGPRRLVERSIMVALHPVPSHIGLARIEEPSANVAQLLARRALGVVLNSGSGGVLLCGPSDPATVDAALHVLRTLAPPCPATTRAARLLLGLTHPAEISADHQTHELVQA